MKSEQLVHLLSESKGVIIYGTDGTACKLLDEDVMKIIHAVYGQMKHDEKGIRG